MIVPNRGKPYQLRKGSKGILWYPTKGNLWQSKTYDLGLTFVKACSDLWAIHRRKCKHGKKEVSIVT
jgi:hypothetical protein